MSAVNNDIIEPFFLDSSLAGAKILNLVNILSLMIASNLNAI